MGEYTQEVYDLVDKASGIGGIREVFSAIKVIAQEAKRPGYYGASAAAQWTVIEGVASIIENLSFPDDFPGGGRLDV